MSHRLIQRGSKDYFCEVCHQQWTSPSKAYCPNRPVIAYKDRGPLMSKTELNKRGYKTDILPKATCCYRLLNGRMDATYVDLYDPAGLPLKKPRKHKTLHYVESLHWPKAWLPFLESIEQWEGEHKRRQNENIRIWWAMCLDIGRMASPLLSFTPDEIRAFAGETIEFQFPLIPIRTEWNERRVSIEQAEELVDLLVSRYRWWKWDAMPKPTEDELEARRAKREAIQQVELAESRQKQLELPTWITPNESQPPAKQQALF